MNKINEIVNKMKKKPYLLEMGAGKLAKGFNCTREDIWEAKKIVRDETNKDTSKLELKSRWQSANGEWLESYKTKKDDGEIVSVEEIYDIIERAIGKKRPTPPELTNFDTGCALNIWIADEHIGADTKNGLFDNDYDYNEIKNRFDKILEEIGSIAITIGGFDRINIGILGDSFDGWDGETTRGGHKLPQSLSNREAFNTFLDIYLYFIDALVDLDVSNSIHFHFVANSNHGGDFDYIGYKTLELYMNKVYPDIKVNIYDKFVNHFEYGCHTFIISHGKDQENRKFGFPLVINEQTKNFLNDYMSLNKMQPHVHFVKGDLHRSNLDLDRMCSSNASFSYQNVASVFGASKWIMDNYGATMPMCEYDIVNHDNHRVMRGHIYLK